MTGLRARRVERVQCVKKRITRARRRTGQPGCGGADATRAGRGWTASSRDPRRVRHALRIALSCRESRKTPVRAGTWWVCSATHGDGKPLQVGRDALTRPGKRLASLREYGAEPSALCRDGLQGYGRNESQASMVGLTHRRRAGVTSSTRRWRRRGRTHGCHGPGRW